MSEFDKVFQQLESPDHPATCDQCGEERTNAGMEGHVCAVSLKHSPLPWKSIRTDTRFEINDAAGFPVLRINGGMIPTKEVEEFVIRTVNQHATLVAQRDRLLRLLRPVTSPTSCYCAVMGDEKCWHCEARELIADVEQEK